MLRIILIRPGATNFDDQGRIKGSLDMPLSDCGRRQAEQTARDLADTELIAVLTAPCESAKVTADHLVSERAIKPKVIEGFKNIDHGLWHGKLVDEVRRQQPRVYRQGEEDPNSVCPPGGETIEDAKDRVVKSLRKVIKKHRDGSIAMVVPEPMASVVHCLLCGDDPKSLWVSELDSGSWEVIELRSENHREAIVG